MKRGLMSIAVASSVLMMNGCANNQPAPDRIVKNVEMKQQVVYEKQSKTQEEIRNEKAAELFQSLPSWVHNPDIFDDAIAVVGIAKNLKQRKMKYVMKIARANAREQFAKQILVYVDTKLKTAMEEASINGDLNIEEAITDGTQEVVKNMKLSGAKQVNSHLGRDGNMYVHMKISTKPINKAMKKKLQQIEEKLVQNTKNSIAREEIKKSMKLIERNADFN